MQQEDNNLIECVCNCGCEHHCEEPCTECLKCNECDYKLYWLRKLEMCAYLDN